MAYVDQSDLVSVARADVDRIFCDDGSGSADLALISFACEQASAYFDSFAIDGWQPAQLAKLVADPLIRANIAWCAMHFGAQGKREWRDANGFAMYYPEFQTATKLFERIGKGAARSREESTAGKHPMIGGKQVLQQEPTYIFAPTPKNPRGLGGY